MWRNVYTIVIILIVLVAEDAWSSFYSSTRTWSHFNAPSSSANCNTRATRPCWYIFSSSPYLPSSNYSQLLTNGLQSSCANLSSLLIIMCSIHFHFSNSHPPLFYTLPFHPPFIATCLLCVPFIFYSTGSDKKPSKVENMEHLPSITWSRYTIEQIQNHCTFSWPFVCLLVWKWCLPKTATCLSTKNICLILQWSTN